MEKEPAVVLLTGHPGVGKTTMELLSSSFRETILALLEGTAVAVGTIVRRPHPFADKVKAHPRVATRVVTPENRDALPEEIEAVLRRRPSR